MNTMGRLVLFSRKSIHCSIECKLNFEVCISDNNSDGNILEIIELYKHKLKINLKIHVKK